MFDDSYVIVDLETTGLSPKNGEIIEIGALKVVDNKIVDRMDVFVRPSRPLSFFTTNLTGITNEMVAEGLDITTALNVFNEFSEGINLVINKFYDVLKKVGVVEIKSLGEEFNPKLHEAIKVVEDEKFEKNTICEVLQKGFMLNEAVLRHALVVVANP